VDDRWYKIVNGWLRLFLGILEIHKCIGRSCKVVNKNNNVTISFLVLNSSMKFGALVKRIECLKISKNCVF